MAEASGRARSYDMTVRAAAAEQTRARVLEAGYALLRDHPYDSVSLKQIAQSAGVSAQTVIVHFGSKEGLLEAIHAWHSVRETGLRELSKPDLLAAAELLCRRYDEIGPATLRLIQIEDRVAVARSLVARGREFHCAWVERVFGEALPATGPARQRALAALAAAYDLQTWHSLRATLGPEDTVQAMAALARGALQLGART
jgi:AcrR family transcriptional regulator